MLRLVRLSDCEMWLLQLVATGPCDDIDDDGYHCGDAKCTYCELNRIASQRNTDQAPAANILRAVAAVEVG